MSKMSRALSWKSLFLGQALLGASLLAAGNASAEAPPAPVNGTIGYVVTDLHWAGNFTADDKVECPEGVNDGPREQFKVMFPEDGTKRKLFDTQMKIELGQFFPDEWKDPTPYHDAVGKTAMGLNLDGKVGPKDYTSPEGAPGIDNEFYRAVGCVRTYRGPNGNNYVFPNKSVRSKAFNRIMIEVTGVKDLKNSPDVTVTVMRGTEEMRTNAAGLDIMPGGSQMIDTRWGKRFKTVFKGKIVDGVLTTEAKDGKIPWWQFAGGPGEYLMRGMRLQLKVTPTSAEGLIAGYTDVDTWNNCIVMSWHTLINSYGQFSPPSVYQAMHRLADAYPDPKTGANTAISSAIEAKFAQVFIVHTPETRPQANAGQPRQPGAPSREAGEQR